MAEKMQMMKRKKLRLKITIAIVNQRRFPLLINSTVRVFFLTFLKCQMVCAV